jgi:hypothetical protein
MWRVYPHRYRNPENAIVPTDVDHSMVPVTDT